MTKSIDVREFASDSFLEQLERLQRLYETLGAALGVEQQLLQEERHRVNAKAPEAYREWEHLIFDERACDLEECEGLQAQFVLVQLEMAVRRLLNESQWELEAYSTESATRLQGLRFKKARGDWLAKTKTRFASEFGIDLHAGPAWNAVEELVMARNAITHPGSLAGYKKARPHARYLNGNEFKLTPDDLIATMQQLREFRTWLRTQVKARQEQ